MSFPVVTMNMRDGSVTGHAAGCADLKRGRNKFAEPEQADFVMNVETKTEAWAEYNGDFLPECEGGVYCPDHDEAAGRCGNAYDIKWLPCAAHVPA